MKFIVNFTGLFFCFNVALVFESNIRWAALAFSCWFFLNLLDFKLKKPTEISDEKEPVKVISPLKRKDVEFVPTNIITASPTQALRKEKETPTNEPQHLFVNYQMSLREEDSNETNIASKGIKVKSLDNVLKSIGKSKAELQKLTDEFKRWFALTILKPLLQEKDLFQIQKYLQVDGFSSEQLLDRIKDLIVGDYCNSSEDDVTLILHLFCCFMDSRTPSTMPSFTHTFYSPFKSHTQPTLCIKQYRHNHFVLQKDGNLWDFDFGKRNVWQCLVIFMIVVKKEWSGFVNGVNVNGKSVGLDWL